MGSKSKSNKMMPKWKAQSLQLRAAMSTCHGGSQSSSSGGGVSAAAAAAAAAAMDNRVECPHCGRKFGETQAERHIPKCKDTVHKPRALGQSADGRVRAGGADGVDVVRRR